MNVWDFHCYYAFTLVLLGLRLTSAFALRMEAHSVIVTPPHLEVDVFHTTPLPAMTFGIRDNLNQVFGGDPPNSVRGLDGTPGAGSRHEETGSLTSSTRESGTAMAPPAGSSPASSAAKGTIIAVTITGSALLVLFSAPLIYLLLKWRRKANGTGTGRHISFHRSMMIRARTPSDSIMSGGAKEPYPFAMSQHV
ncbi:unnamed protein product [Mycena citricolor]|uniref:Mid2 domain-containing protein n=1 Tax=Mycena citricolor TaxID=2018698 RepID=A0AAD2H893_9AGAR|nr:unnamed protein product [Mycena citricolor]